MNYNPHLPIAVFLGPSLEQPTAARILAANYYAPARLGDIYRLLGAGVQIIVLIDGVFHQTASVWQRELLEALDNGIRVIGAASMGALRAAELHPFGMIGCGTIFEWYRDGVIEGDDEVALNHADESLGFRPLSEPLVNIRYNLWQAVQQGYLSCEQGAALIEAAHKTYYAERSYEVLQQSPPVKAWPPKVQAQLTQFLRQKAVNLKQQDAVGVLRYCAGLAKKNHHPDISTRLPRHQGRYYRSVRYRHRGFLRGEGYLMSGEALLAAAMQEVELVQTLRPTLIKNYFLGLWAKQRRLTCPPDYLKTFEQRVFTKESQWLRANGLTEREFQTELEQRALLAWVGEQEPGAFGLDFEPYIQFVEALASPSFGLRQAAEVCYLAAWARDNGITCPPVTAEKFIKKWEETHHVNQQAAPLKKLNLPERVYLAVLAAWAGFTWLIEKGPLYFGYASWSFEVALLKELQLTGQAARIAATVSAAAPSFPLAAVSEF